jgi:hypothetical protein
MYTKAVVCSIVLILWEFASVLYRVCLWSNAPAAPSVGWPNLLPFKKRESERRSAEAQHYGRFENFCPKIISNKFQFQITRSKKSEKIKTPLLFQTFKLDVTFVFSDFVLIGAQNWDLSEIVLGQKYKKSAIVRRHGGALRNTLNCAVLLCALRFLYKSTTTAHTTVAASQLLSSIRVVSVL